jgi:hypothetical protein
MDKFSSFVMRKLMTLVRNGRGRKTAQTPPQGLWFRKEPCGGDPQQDS